MKHILLGLCLIFSISVFADATFEHGTEYTSTLYRGQVQAYCNSTSRMHYCRADDLNPRMMTRLVLSEGVEADRFEVTATWENGKKVTKKGKLKNGKSKRINLWIATLFQRPLLDYGKNIIDYKLTKKGESVEEGSFEVTVNRAPTVHCSYGWIRFFNDSDCNNVSRVCNEYFSRGYCSK